MDLARNALVACGPYHSEGNRVVQISHDGERHTLLHAESVLIKKDGSIIPSREVAKVIASVLNEWVRKEKANP